MTTQSPKRPLYVRYRTEDGQKYLFDAGTGQIVQVSDALDAVVDDYGRLTLEETIQKHAEYDRGAILSAWEGIEALRRDHSLLGDHFPTQMRRLAGIRFDGVHYSLPDFLTTFCEMVILCVTEQCNLRCDYCCYSGRHPNHRTHGPKRMTFATAKKAVDQLLRSCQIQNEQCGVTFYGGEPLLEFDLIRETVRYTREEARRLGKNAVFSITTNGTLLDDEKADFFVENKFLVMVSMDGPKEAHDRYRVFAGTRRGSFDIVRQNIDRFAERHPDYLLRGLSMTVAPPILWDAVDAFLKEYIDRFPMMSVSPVQAESVRGESGLQRGCPGPDRCEDETFADGYRMILDRDVETMERLRKEYIRTVCEVGLQEAKRRMPLLAMLIEPVLRKIHKRNVTDRHGNGVLLVTCMPGYSRRFCDADGNYRVCERVNESENYIVGHVDGGIDTGRSIGLVHARSQMPECGNCEALKNCRLCFAGFDSKGAPEALCRANRIEIASALKDYTTIMNRDSTLFDKATDEESAPLKKLHYIPEPLADSMLKTV